MRELCDLWRGRGLSKKRKIELFEIYVGAKVLYSLETLNLSARDFHFLDTQQMYMIKTMIKSEPTFIIQDEELRFLASKEFLPSKLRIKN